MTHREIESLEFDRELSLEELFEAIDQGKLMRALENLLDRGFQIVSLTGKVLCGSTCATYEKRWPLIIELEPVGYFAANTDHEHIGLAAQQLILLLLNSAHRYLMTSSIHIQAIHEDFHVLQTEHQALMESEARYKELCGQLDQKVKEQLKKLETAQRQLFSSEKMASVGQLAAGIAHEINNPAGFINSNLHSARNYLRDIQQLGEIIRANGSSAAVQAFWKARDFDFVIGDFNDLMQESIAGIKRIAQIVTDLKVFANIDSEDELVVDLNRYIGVSCNMARTNIAERIKVEFEPGELPPIKCRPAYLGQVILGLLMNARDAIEGDGLIFVKSYVKDDKHFVEVSDNGPGIPEAIIERVFEPFFTTRAVGQGKGLGLTYCRDIVKAHGGEITLQSIVGSGTTVTFWIPIHGN